MRSISIYRLNAVLLLALLIIAVLYYAKDFLIPLFFAILLVMLLMPVCRKFEKWGVGRLWASLLGVLIIVLFAAGLIGIIAAQAASLAEDLPEMQQNAQRLLGEIQAYVQQHYGVSPQQQISYLQKGVSKISQSGGKFFASILSGTMGLLTGFVLVLLYFFFLMWKREKYREFFLRLVQTENRREVARELDEISKVAEQYLIGRLISMGFLAVFYITGFLITGLPNAVLVAIVAVLPTIVPYVGAFIGGFFPIAIAMMTGSSEMIIPIAAILVSAQVIDNNVIEPLVEGESLDISPIFTIVAIVIGELLWGIAGMILFIPLFAIIRIICDHIPALNPYSFLLSNEVDEPRWVAKLREFFSRKKKID